MKKLLLPFVVLLGFALPLLIIGWIYNALPPQEANDTERQPKHQQSPQEQLRSPLSEPEPRPHRSHPTSSPTFAVDEKAGKTTPVNIPQIESEPPLFAGLNSDPNLWNLKELRGKTYRLMTPHDPNYATAVTRTNVAAFIKIIRTGRPVPIMPSRGGGYFPLAYLKDEEREPLLQKLKRLDFDEGAYRIELMAKLAIHEKDIIMKFTLLNATKLYHFEEGALYRITKIDGKGGAQEEKA